ncbi:metal ABC transporter substrate-binding protein [Cellulomonas sp. Sa3CUA2]|uniref:Metal ABC transporter substrate-binding protein n=1 Tax=Cellulomonas avistercoris TaxID=2762242 RepID=A0ABR8QIS5_9CELL|nr:metal ABC transporter substrate-binding protein [Cellulomonas avistercoris]MBD7920313.1 metal ABC transporter substrate-binding protein [Cellulomonas avistercoris]
MPSPATRRARSSAVALVLALLLAACAPGAAQSDDRPVVLTTFTVLADLAGNVAGEHLRVESITQVGAEVHGYDPTPGDVARARRADLVLDNGMGLETWFAQFVDDLDAPHVVVSQGVDVLDITGDAYAGRPNPHAWMSPVEAQTYVANIATAFAELDPAHADDYRANAAAYAAELQEVHRDLLDALATVPEPQRVLVTCEGAFSYLARDAGLTERYIWPVNAEQQATPRQVADVIDHVRAHDVPAVFCESTVSDAPMRQVAEATGAVLGGTLYVDSLSEPDGPVPTYLDLLRHDVRVIVEGLTGRAP